ncbi:MAG: helix-turn-helix domain-containing protein [Candidatus Pacebacteria bacterium]|nr:helix-turn-helix domain-containing protein [Candidatus Paceibacterota bacterium]
MTPRDFITHCRIEKACYLLQSSNHSISRIADLAGFGSIYQFSRLFKQRVGSPPSRYARMASNR